MITNIFLSLVWGLLVAITSPLRLLPDAVLDPNITSSIATAANYISTLNQMIPLATIFSVLVAMAVVDGAIVTFRIGNYGIRKIPGIS